MRKKLIERKRKRDRKQEEQNEVKDVLSKKLKTDVHINALDRLGG